MRLVVTGARGLLGTDITASARARGHEVVALSREDLDVTDARRVREVLDEALPDVVVQCAAFTAVDDAEAEPERAMAVNRDGARNVAAAVQRMGARCLYVSTDYVFDGARSEPYATDVEPRPLSAYGRSKLEGERAVLAACSGALVARVSWLYGAARSTFLTTMLGKARSGEALRVVEDEVGGPSWTRSVAATLLDLLDAGVTGVWHAADAGRCSRYELVLEGVRLLGLEADVTPVPASSWPAPARRPAFSALDVSATEEVIGRPIPHWRDALAAFLAESPGFRGRVA